MIRKIFFCLLPFLILGCKSSDIVPSSENVPTVYIKEPQDVTFRSIKLLGEVTNEGSSAATERGFVYSLKNINPSVSDSRVPSGFGKGEFYVTLDNLPINAKYYIRAYSTNSKGTSYSEVKSFDTPKISTVTSNTGRIWIDRNLGAERVATELNDAKAIGYYFQWGRPMDGHQMATSDIVEVLSDSDTPNTSNFIIASQGSTFFSSWQKNYNINLWQGEKGANNVCPTGFRIPTYDEWEKEMNTWTSLDNIGAFNSKLKLVATGRRSGMTGKVDSWANNAIYWSSSFTEAEKSDKTRLLSIDCFYFNGTKVYPIVNAYKATSGTINGIPVRCIKD
jgi:uncharacterized protein (TIGR02145 family)